MTLLEARGPAGVRPPRADALRVTAWGAAVLVVVARLPFVGAPASPDEGGYLLVASQWAPGRSLYGDYWVDRPPLLIGLHLVAVDLGGLVPLRLLGMLAAVATVLLTAALARCVTAPTGSEGAPAAPPLVPVVVAAALVASPLLGATEVDGELLALPFVLVGILAAVRALGSPTARAATAWALGAGAAAAAAALVKQNAVDVVVFAVATWLAGARAAAGRRRLALAFALGAGAVTVVVLAGAASRGTDPRGLVDAVVMFRFQAAVVIHRYGSAVSGVRRVGLVRAALLSGMPLVASALAWRARRPARASGSPGVDLRGPAYALLAWETLAVVGGGSYWHHYLLVLVPGVVVLALAAAQRPPSLRTATAATLAVLVGSAAVTSLQAVGTRRGPGDPTAAVAAYLRAHATRGDTVVVGFGHPDVVWDSGLSSPYPELWSLPVRVRDPRLRRLDAVLASPAAPTWLVVSGTSLATWGVAARTADRTVAQRYVLAADLRQYRVWRLADGSSTGR